MTKESFQKLFSILILILGNGFLFASEPPPTPVVYVSPQTVITGFENVHLSNTEIKTIRASKQSEAIIYISANTIFTATDELLQQVTLMTASQSKPQKSQERIQKKTKQSVTTLKSNVCENKLPNPFDSIPHRNTEKSVLSTFSILTTFSKPTFLAAFIIHTNPCDFLNSNRSDRPQSMLQWTDLKSDFYRSQHTTRPPPSATRGRALIVA